MTRKQAIQATIEEMTSAFNRGDIDAVMRTYEPAAVVVGEPGVAVSGDGPLRAMFAGFVAAKARFTFHGNEVVDAGDIALHLTPWRMTGVNADGTPLSASGLSIAVLRRQLVDGSPRSDDERWLMVIDHPFGDGLLANLQKGAA